ncbi:unnamed protein product [Rotaria sp. Silwood2]|nr:unnamed protein product [Rotaria sp. Silwood2]
MANERKKTFIMIKFLAHLINQRMLHEKIAFQILDVLLRNVSNSHFSTLNNLLHGPLITERTKDMIRVLFTVRRNQFEEYPAIKSGLNSVNENDKYTHMLEYLDLCDPETMLDEFKYDEQYEVNENEYKELRKTFLGENNDDEGKSSSNSLQNDNDQSNISAAVIDLSSSGSSVADKEN